VLRQIIFLIAVTIIPALELRASIPYGILGKEAMGITPGMMPWPVISAICIAANIALGMIVFMLLAPLLQWLQTVPAFQRYLNPLLLRTRTRLEPYVKRYGELGVALFIGIPLPGSGVYSGAVGAFVLGLDRRRFFVANILGVVIAGSVVTMLTLLIQAGLTLPWLQWIIKS